jgi:2,4-dienoyl-CoA reductase-like NADH-dependent reductase (Old Yellow Enzyme family)
MAPMTRGFSPGGVPGPDVAAYYRRRAAGGVGLIITEGTWIPEAHAANDPKVPDFHGARALAGWAAVLQGVHEAGGRIVPQLWHTGISAKPDVEGLYGDRKAKGAQIGPSGLLREGVTVTEPMTEAEIETVSQAYVDAAACAFRMGFDGVELHGAHGYLIDQFFWAETNRRSDRYGGSIAGRTGFAADIVRAIRARTAPDFPILLRFSQWKLVDYAAKLARDPAELDCFLAPLTDAGVDVFHCSQRRFWEPEFDGSELSLAGWTRKLTGRPVITVGSVSLDHDIVTCLIERNEGAGTTSLDPLLERLAAGEFDLVAVGRALLSDADWVRKVRDGAPLLPFSLEALTRLE